MILFRGVNDYPTLLVSFMLEPEAVHLAAVTSCDERLYMIVLDILHEFGKLILRKQRLDLDLLCLIETATHVVQRAATYQIIDDISSYLLMLRADDTYAFALAERGGKVVNHEAIDPRTDQSDHYHSEVVDHECRAADNSTANGD